jgi:hypothetical protein
VQERIKDASLLASSVQMTAQVVGTKLFVDGGMTLYPGFPEN